MLRDQALYRVSVDVGGTFTDLVALDMASGEMINIKVPSVPRGPEEGVMEAMERFLADKEPGAVGMVGHATTIATNALFGQLDLELPKSALITTKGFRDVIEIGRQRRAEVYNLFFKRPEMLVGRRHRYEVEERVDQHGRVLTPLKMEELENVLEDIEREGIESLSIGFINSYVNQDHEEEVSRRVRDRFPDLHVTTSSSASSGYREYERFSTAVVNSTLMPIVHTYLSRLSESLSTRGVGVPLYVMQSNGGMAEADIVSHKPVTVVESGPASGVIAAAWLGEQVGRRDVMSFDMGGTTAKAGTVRGRIPEVVPEYEVAGKVHMGRLLQGSGYPVRFPFIDLAECSAGGGTIAWVDEGGALNVGPVSAGASPGPACYGKGGREPTITDANVILGRLNPESILGGGMPIYPGNATMALRRLGERLDMDAYEVAASVVRITNSLMSKILKIVSVERGFDPRSFALVAFGGAGPMHACALAEELGVREIVIPPYPGMFSALGLLTADLFHDYSRSLVKSSEDVDPMVVEELFNEMENEGRRTLITEEVAPDFIAFKRTLELRYRGQSYELAVDVGKPFDQVSLKEGVDRFHKRHNEIYGYDAVDEPVEVINVGLRAIGRTPKPRLADVPPLEGDASSKVTRLVYYEGPENWLETPVYSREALGAGHEFKGPSIVEQYDSTTVVYPGWDVSVGKYGVMTLRRGEY